MHEFSITQSLCEVAREEARRHDACRVRSLTCRLGVCRQIVPELLHTAFEILADDELLRGAELIVETEPVTVDCQSCGVSTTVQELPFQCPGCGSTDIRCSGGDDISLLSMEIDKESDDGHSGSSTSG